jgi:hypothetical protein
MAKITRNMFSKYYSNLRVSGSHTITMNRTCHEQTKYMVTISSEKVF